MIIEYICLNIKQTFKIASA